MKARRPLRSQYRRPAPPPPEPNPAERLTPSMVVALAHVQEHWTAIPFSTHDIRWATVLALDERGLILRRFAVRWQWRATPLLLRRRALGVDRDG